MLNQKLLENPLMTKKDTQEALLDLLIPLEDFLETSKFGLKFDTGGCGYDEMIREVEALLRPLWGIIPFLAGGGQYAPFEKYLHRIKKGTNPKDESYWGNIGDKDQRMVEMAAIGLGMCLLKEAFWDVLTDDEKSNLYQWLNQINDYEMPMNNWRFFRVLVNLGFKNCDMPYNAVQMKKGLEEINSFYLGNGWYSDGYRDQIDYYVPFAIHFYSLIYVKVMGDEDCVYTPLFKSRAIEFAQSFKGFFDESGAAVPFGRSMIYRFAQSAFWGALAFAEIEALPWGELKHLCLQNLRYWFKQDIFSASGKLTVGYHYRNLIMGEGYNAYGSPYWALKSFICLALPDDHPFWLAEEVVVDTPNHIVIPEARAILQRENDGSQVQMFTMGQHTELHAHGEAKYEKFVYSSTFGFSVSKGMIGLSQGAFDNTLAVSDDHKYYRMRHGVQEYRIEKEYLYSVWKPYKDVEIKTYVIPLMPWHIRIHQIKTGRELFLADGGFAINGEGKPQISESQDSLYCINDKKISGIVSLNGEQTCELVVPEANTNVMHAKTLIPTLKSECSQGEFILASAILGTSFEKKESISSESPQLELLNQGFRISYQDKIWVINCLK